MANLIIISGPQAVGKMTVAENLRDKIGYSLMVNHDSIEISDKIFKRGSEAQKELKSLIREDVFNLAIAFNTDSKIHKMTSGTHAAYLYKDGKVITSFEDIVSSSDE